MTDDVIDGEVVGEELVPRPQTATLFRTDDPAEVIAQATRTAEPLAKAVRDRRLSVQISGREHVRVEGWTLLGSMVGVFPVVVWTRKLEDGWEARVEARTLAGQVVGAAEAECLYSERLWKTRDDYALRSMAQTRATSKALRMPLGFVMSLAGFAETPAEEMDAVRVKVISDAQRKRLRALQHENGVPDDELKRLVLEIASVESSKEIPADRYDDLCQAVKDYGNDGVPF